MRGRVFSVVSAMILAAASARPQTKGGATMGEKEITELMRNLELLNDSARMRLLSDVDRQRKDLLAALLKQMGTTSSSNVQAAVMFLIGRHRLTEGVTELTRRIDFAAPSQGIPEPEPLWETYPAMEALISIGQPAIPSMIRLLATENNDNRRNLALKVIRYVEQDVDVARCRLNRAEAEENDVGRKAMLRRAQSQFETAFSNR